MKKLAIFASGRGSNARALIDACRSGLIAARPVVLFSDHPDAPALAMARAAGVDCHAFAPREFADKAAYENAVVEMLRPYAPDYICLAGYMRIVGAPILAVYEGQIVNIHPALLPSFPGLHAQRQAIDAGVKVSGCTVHFVDAGMDSGPIIMQTAVPVFASDDETSLAERILTVEHPTYVEAMAALCRDELCIVKRKVVRRTASGEEGLWPDGLY